MRLIAACLLLLASANTYALAQDRLPPGVRGPDSAMATRNVSKYLALERSLQDAIRDHDAAAIKRLLVEDFNVHSADQVDAIAMDVWMKNETRATIQSVGVRDLNVREFDELAVVSFLLDRSSTVKGKTIKTTSFVVDVWRQSAGLLVTRYISDPRHPLPTPTRPSGRE